MLPVKRIDGSFLMRHEHVAGTLVELMEIAQNIVRRQWCPSYAPEAFDVIVTTHKTIDLVFHTQVYKLKRDMTAKIPFQPHRSPSCRMRSWR